MDVHKGKKRLKKPMKIKKWTKIVTIGILHVFFDYSRDFHSLGEAISLARPY